MNTELLQKLGNMDQLAGIRETELRCGSGKGLTLLELYNAAGIRLTVVPDRCMDIYDFSYKGVNFSFHSKNGLHANNNPAEDEFFHRWPGGMLTTCGLANVGAACIDDGVHPTHGRIGSAPARYISVQESWQNGEYRLSVSGNMEETRLYGRKLSLQRTISLGFYSKTVEIEDIISNESVLDEEYMLLYHFNFGYPLLDLGSKVVCSGKDMKPQSTFSDEPGKICAPGETPPHQTFLYLSKTVTRAAVINPGLEMGGFIEYEGANLPYMLEWKNLMPHEYVVALEPCNCIGLGRAKERENGTLAKLPAYSSITNRLKLGALDGSDISNIRSYLEH